MDKQGGDKPVPVEKLLTEDDFAIIEEESDSPRDVSREQETEYAKRRKKQGGGPIWVKKEQYALCKMGAQQTDMPMTMWIGLAIEEKAQRDGIVRRQAKGWRRHGSSGS